jgi:hypothetical protein
MEFTDSKISQDGTAILGILKDVLLSFQADFPGVKVVRIRSDNAGCYHGNGTIPMLHQLGSDVGVKIERYDFSEAQFGKG